MGDLDRATQAYESALRMNPFSVPAMNSISCILRTKEEFPKAVEYLQSILQIDSANGEIWGSLGHCYLMMDDLQKAYSAYQQALYHLRDPKVSEQASDQVGDMCLHVIFAGAQALVWHRHFVRSLWLARTCRGGVLPGHANAARLREGERDILPARDNL